MAAILIVDAQQQYLEFWATLLGNSNHSLFEASNGVSALSIVREFRPDLVITEIRMEGMNGLELVRKIREDAQVANTSIIFYSALEFEERRVQKIFGVRRALTKPWDPGDLLRIVQKELNVVACLRKPAGAASTRVEAQTAPWPSFA